MTSWPVRRRARRLFRGNASALACIFAGVFAFSSGAVRPLAAQQAQPNTYAGFDGQTVSAVDIAAGPTVNVDDLRHLIQQKPGQPFSEQAINNSVAALQRTKRFTEVQMSVTPDQAGLHITFILQPADYIGILQFPGAGTRFAYTALMQAANIPDQSPYVPGMEKLAAEGVLNYLHTRGFFTAEVTPDIQRDESHHLVNILFRCSLGPQAKISEIEFTNIPSQQSDSARRALRGWWARLKRVSLKPGQKYSEPRVTKAVPFVRDHIPTQGRLAPSIHLAPAVYDAATNRVEVILELTPGPKTSVKVQGAKVSSKQLSKLIPIYQENAVDQELVNEGENNLTAYFQAKGYFDSTVNSDVTRQSNQVNVVYHVDRGAKHRVKGVYFDGDHYFDDKQLSAYVTVKKGFLFFTRGHYSQQLLNKSVATLTQAYKDAGFADISIQPKVEDFEPEVDVTFEIKEGTQDHVASLELVGNKTQTLPALSRKYPLKMDVGKPYSPKLLDAERSQLLAAYLDLGYLNAAVLSTAAPVQGVPHKMAVTYNINEGPRAYISDVVLLGQQHTNPHFLLQTSAGSVKKGQPQSEGNFLQTESNLYDLGVFDFADVIALRPIVHQTQEEALIKVHESPLNTMDIGGGIEIIPRDGSIPVNSVAVPGLPPVSIGNKFKVSQKSYVGPRFTFDFVRHDIRGRAETATFGAIFSRLDQRAFITYADPHLHGSTWSSLLGISVERTTENPVYTAAIGQASIQAEKNLNAKRTEHLIGRYSFQRTDLSRVLIPGLVLPEDQHVRLSGFDVEYIRDSRDKPLDAHRGVYQTADFGVTATALDASANFFRFLGQSAFYVPVKPWLTWATNFRVGFAAPFSSSSVPISERFFTGGADSLRGFPINGAGPQRSLPVCTDPSNPATCNLISVPIGGDMLFIVNTEGRFPLPLYHNLGGVLFYDGGNVYSNLRLGELTGNFTHSVGAGLRYNTPVGPVRFDFGYRITTVPGVKATQYFVTLGQSF